MSNGNNLKAIDLSINASCTFMDNKLLWFNLQFKERNKSLIVSS